MKSINETLSFLKEEKKPPHELALVVDEIQKALGFQYNDKYGYRYWLRKAKGVRYHQIVGILKEMENIDPKYNKGGLLTNKLKNVQRNKI